MWRRSRARRLRSRRSYGSGRSAPRRRRTTAGARGPSAGPGSARWSRGSSGTSGGWRVNTPCPDSEPDARCGPTDRAGARRLCRRACSGCAQGALATLAGSVQPHPESQGGSVPTPLATRRLLMVRLPGTDVPSGTLDVHFDGHRVWSTPVRWNLGSAIAVAWPRALRPYLRGRTYLTITSSSTGEEIAAGQVRFPGSGRVSVTDKRGRWLSINKWDRLGPTL